VKNIYNREEALNYTEQAMSNEFSRSQGRGKTIQHLPPDSSRMYSNVKTLIHFRRVKLSYGLNSSIFWDIMPCRLVKVNHHFGGLCHLHLYG
jgi:hypothetical protein